MRTWLLLGCLVAGITLCMRAPLSTARRRPVGDAPRQDSAGCALEGRTVHSVTGQPLANVHILLSNTNPQRARRSATITGTVVDRRNRIVARARVGIEETRRDGAPLRIVRANSRGSFRIGLLPPGRYRITAEVDPAATPPSSTPNGTERLGGRILTVRNRAEVAPAVVVVIELEAGEELSDVRVLLPASGRMVRLALT
jgi:hypothetical protein